MFEDTSVTIDRDRKTGKIHYQVVHRADASPVLRQAEIARAKEEALLNTRNEFRPQARLPFVEVMNFRAKYGIDPLNVKPDQEKKFWQIMQSEYSKFLTTQKKVHRPVKRQRAAGVVIPPECLRSDA